MRSGRFLSFIQLLIWRISAVCLERKECCASWPTALNIPHPPSQAFKIFFFFSHHSPLNPFNYWWRVLSKSRAWFLAWGGLWSPPPPGPPQTWVEWSKFCSSPHHPQWAHIPPQCWMRAKDRAQIKSGMILPQCVLDRKSLNCCSFKMRISELRAKQNLSFQG